MISHLQMAASLRWRGTAVLGFLLTLMLITSAQTNANSTSFFNFDLDLNDGVIVSLNYPHADAGDKPFNMVVTVSGTGSISLEVEDASNTPIWSNSVSSGETSWGTGSFTTGQNDIIITHNNDGAVSIEVTFYTLPELGSSGFNWQGTAASDGVNSEITAVFEQSGLYTFDMIAATGRFQFVANDNYIRKTAESPLGRGEGNLTSSTFFIPAGTHTFAIEQDDNAGADWQVEISTVGTANDTLPYTKSGGQIGGSTNDFTQEYLPIHLAAAAEVNIKLAVTGSDEDIMALTVLDTLARPLRGSSATLSNVAGGETVWTTVDLPAGTSYLMLEASGNDSLSYVISVEEISAPTTAFAGLNLNDSSPNSTMRVNFPIDGLYQFDFTVNEGEFQLQLEEELILKTATENSNVTFFVPAGTHEAIIIQAEGDDGGADWELDIMAVSNGHDALPYSKTSNEFGGGDSDFTQEWLPIALDDAQQVNLRLSLDGQNGDDTISLDVYQAGSDTPNATITAISTNEEIWQTFFLSAGINRLEINSIGSQNEPISYELEISAVPTVSEELSWAGVAEDDGLNSTATLNFPTTGLYRFSVSSSNGAANIALNNSNFAISPMGASSSLSSSYDIQVAEGMHEVQIVQDPAFSETDWEASVEPITAVSSFFTFDGVLESDEIITQIYPQSDNSRDFNFEISVTGGSVQVDIDDADTNAVWSDTILDGEESWGTGTLSSGDNSISFSQVSGTPIVSFIMYDLPTAGTGFAGVSNSAGISSTVHVIFPQDGLYTFSNAVNSGAYHLTINDDFIQKTVVETGDVTYFIPAGTHELAVEQNSATGADWELEISDVGAAIDSLPYGQSGTIGGPANDTGKEYLTINLGGEISVNGGLLLIGTDGDTATLIGLDSSDNTIVTHTVNANESLWFTADMPAGLNRFMLEANKGNVAPLAYMLGIDELATSTFSWEGVSNPAGENSHIRVTFAASGLYTFDADAENGRFQLLVNDEFIQKTAEPLATRGGVAPTNTFYVPAGTHDLYIMQDTTGGAEWSVDISSASSSYDSLPRQEAGGIIGGAGNDFGTEWVPIKLAAETAVNLQFNAMGDTADRLSLVIYPFSGDTPIKTITTIYGTESFITSFTIPAGGVRLAVEANGSNSNGMEYELEIVELQDVTSLMDDSESWSGVSLYNGLNSIIEWETFVSGTYSITASSPDGFFSLIIDQPTYTVPAAPNFDTEFTTSLGAGLHTITIQQSNSSFFAQTSWTVTATLMMANAPTITAVSPTTAADDATTTITIDGSNFMAGATVALADGSNSVAVGNVTVISGNQITAVIPTNATLGSYDITVTNPDTQSVTEADAVEIFRNETIIYLPIILNNN